MGKLITAQASAAPASVKARRICRARQSRAPTGPCTPNTTSSSQPVTTGGSASGRWTRAFSAMRPGKRPRARRTAVATASGRPQPTARAATPSVRRTACRSSSEKVSARPSGPGKTVVVEHVLCGWRVQVMEKLARLLGVAGLHDRERVADGIVAVGGEDAGDGQCLAHLDIGSIDDTGGGFAALDQQQRRTHRGGRGQPVAGTFPNAEFLQGLLRVDARGDRLGVADSQASGGAKNRVDSEPFVERDGVKGGLGLDENQVIAEQHRAGAGGDQIVAADVVHPFLVGAGKDVGGCAMFDLLRQGGTGGEGEDRLRVPGGGPERADVLHGIGQAGCGEHG